MSGLFSVEFMLLFSLSTFGKLCALLSLFSIEIMAHYFQTHNNFQFTHLRPVRARARCKMWIAKSISRLLHLQLFTTKAIIEFDFERSTNRLPFNSKAALQNNMLKLVPQFCIFNCRVQRHSTTNYNTNQKLSASEHEKLIFNRASTV